MPRSAQIKSTPSARRLLHRYRKESAAPGATIDLHTDQGLYIAFTPALTVGAEDVSAATFTLERRDGSRAEVALDAPRYASCVFVMLGDGVAQYAAGREAGLRAAPHALEMHSNVDRAWYGLMVLPPDDAVSPLHGDKTFGELKALTRAGDADAAHVGCSRNLAARELAEEACAADQLYCWYRCMDLVNHDGDAVSEEICADQGYAHLKCTDVFRQPSDGFSHGDYYPQCTNYVHDATPFPSIAPADEELCGDAYEAEAAADAAAHAGSVDLVYEGRSWQAAYFVPYTVGQLAWSVSSDSKRVTISHLTSGRVGWMAIGLRHPDGKKNGMNGAPVIMAIPGGGAVDGFADVDQYRIDDEQSSFRHWYATDPGADLTDASLEVGEGNCFARATYTLGSFSSEDPFDASTCTDLIWAVSTDSDLASDPLFLARGMHETRGHLRVNFLAADGACAEEDDGALEPQSKKSSSSSSGPDTALVAGVVAAAVIVLALGVAGAYHLFRRRAAAPDDLAVKGESIEIKEESKEQPATD